MKRLVAGLLVLFSMQAHAGFITGTKLLELEGQQGKAAPGSPMGAYSGFVSGVFDMLEGFKAICPDHQITLGQVNATVSRYLQANGDKLGQPAHLLVGNALTAAYACPKK